MTDWLEIGNCRIACGDCLQILPELEAGSVDCIVTDPPYGLKEARNKNASRGGWAPATDYGFSTWDDSIPPRQVFDEMRRVSKQQVIFGGIYFTEHLPPSSSWAVWDKDNGRNDFADCELAWTSHKRAVRRIKWRWAGMFQGDMRHKDARVHPTQKPEAVMRWILNTYTEPNALVLDPYLGSGTTLTACIQTGRRGWGIEREPKYFSIAEKRIRNAWENRQGKLF